MKKMLQNMLCERKRGEIVASIEEKTCCFFRRNALLFRLGFPQFFALLLQVREWSECLIFR